MTRILVISSDVASAQVGGNITRFVLQRLGHEVVFLPTVLLSNPPDQPLVAGEAVAVSLLEQMVDVYARSGKLGFDAVFVGYLPSPAHVRFGVQTIARLRTDNTRPLICLDPIMGDDSSGEDGGTLYIKEETAQAIRDDLAPQADIMTPNRFELGWLTGTAARGQKGITDAASRLAARTVLVTSAIQDENTIGTFLYEDGSGHMLTHPRLPDAPKGTGDFLAALFVGNVLDGAAMGTAFAHAVNVMSAMMSTFADHDAMGGLPLIATQSDWSKPPPIN